MYDDICAKNKYHMSVYIHTGMIDNMVSSFILKKLYFVTTISLIYRFFNLKLF